MILFTLAGRDAFDVHLRQSADERFLAALITLEDFGAKTSLTVLRHAQLDLARRVSRLRP